MASAPIYFSRKLCFEAAWTVQVIQESSAFTLTPDGTARTKGRSWSNGRFNRPTAIFHDAREIAWNKTLQITQNNGSLTQWI